MGVVCFVEGIRIFTSDRSKALPLVRPALFMWLAIGVKGLVAGLPARSWAYSQQTDERPVHIAHKACRAALVSGCGFWLLLTEPVPC
jgi:hypothetical protein